MWNPNSQIYQVAIEAQAEEGEKAAMKHYHEAKSENKLTRGPFGSAYLVERCKCGAERTWRAIPGGSPEKWQIGKWRKKARDKSK